MDTTLFGTWALTQALLPLLRKSPQARIGNVTSGAGSHGDTAFGLTRANEMRTDRVLINAVCPGFTATFEGGAQMGSRPVAEDAASVIWAALLPDDGPTAGFFRDGKVPPW
jgi:NAD(P)-dependent dehydrogenase (short-subunit alcohol dehydrogenase family)